MNYAARFHNAKRIVVKVGTSTLTYETGAINYRQVEKLVGILSDLQSSGREIILVTSAAVSVGTSKLRLSERPKDIPGKQAAAAVGQCELMYMYDRLFTKYHHVVAQLLLTRNIIENTERADHVRNTLGRLISSARFPSSMRTTPSRSRSSSWRSATTTPSRRLSRRWRTPTRWC